MDFFIFMMNKLSLLHWESLMHSPTGHGVVWCSFLPLPFSPSPPQKAKPSHPSLV